MNCTGMIIEKEVPKLRGDIHRFQDVVRKTRDGLDRRRLEMWRVILCEVCRACRRVKSGRDGMIARKARSPLRLAGAIIIAVPSLCRCDICGCTVQAAALWDIEEEGAAVQGAIKLCCWMMLNIQFWTRDSIRMKGWKDWAEEKCGTWVGSSFWSSKKHRV